MTTKTKNEDKAQALIDSLVPKLLDSLKDKINQQVEDQIKPLLDKHTQLQDRLADNARDDDAMAKMAAQIAELSGKPKDAPTAIFATRDQVMDTPTYRKLKAQADEAGIPLIRRENGDEGPGKTVYTPG